MMELVIKVDVIIKQLVGQMDLSVHNILIPFVGLRLVEDIVQKIMQ
jgi:hypothetical protein